MKKIAEIKRRLTELRKQRDTVVEQIRTLNAELAEAYERRRFTPVVCTERIAHEWSIPKVRGSFENKMNMVILDLVPDPTNKKWGQKKRMAVNRLINFLKANNLVLVLDVVFATEGSFKGRRNFGLGTRILLKQCLSWNGLEMGTAIVRGILDIQVNFTVEALLDQADVDWEVRQKIQTAFMEYGPDYVPKSAKDLLLSSRPGLKKYFPKLDDKCLDALEAGLKTIGRKLRPS